MGSNCFWNNTHKGFSSCQKASLHFGRLAFVGRNFLKMGDCKSIPAHSRELLLSPWLVPAQAPVQATIGVVHAVFKLWYLGFEPGSALKIQALDQHIARPLLCPNSISGAVVMIRLLCCATICVMTERCERSWKEIPFSQLWTVSNVIADCSKIHYVDAKHAFSPCFFDRPCTQVYREKCIKPSLHGLSPIEYRRKLGLIRQFSARGYARRSEVASMMPIEKLYYEERDRIGLF